MARIGWDCWREGHERDTVHLFAGEDAEQAAEAAARHFTNSGAIDPCALAEGESVWIVCRQDRMLGHAPTFRVEVAPYEEVVLRARDCEEVTRGAR